MPQSMASDGPAAAQMKTKRYNIPKSEIKAFNSDRWGGPLALTLRVA